MSVSLRFSHLTVICEFSIRVASFIRGGPRCSQASDDLRETSLIKETMPFDFPPMVLHLGIFEWIMPHVYHFFVSFVFLFFFFVCFCFFTFCAQQLLWNLGTEYTKYDRTVGYLRPLQLPWPNQVNILSWHCATLTPQATGGDERAQGAPGAVK